MATESVGLDPAMAKQIADAVGKMNLTNFKVDLSGVDFSNINNVIKQSDPALYALMKADALENARKVSGFVGGTGEAISAQGYDPNKLQSTYNGLISFGYSPEVANANTYGVANTTLNTELSRIAADNAAHSFEGQLKNALQVWSPVLLPMAAVTAGAYITSSLVSNGVMAAGAGANAVGAGVANAAINIASGQDPETAIKNALISTGINVATPEITKAVNSVVSNPAVTKSIVNAGSAALKVAAAGGNSDAITNALVGSIASSAATSAINTAITDVDPTTAKVLGSTISGAINNGPEGAIKGVLNTLATETGKSLWSSGWGIGGNGGGGGDRGGGGDNGDYWGGGDGDMAALNASQVTASGMAWKDAEGNLHAWNVGDPIPPYLEANGFYIDENGDLQGPTRLYGDAENNPNLIAVKEQADREQAARDAVRASEKTIEAVLTNAGLVKTADDIQALNPVTVTGKAITADDIQALNPVTVTGKAITGSTGSNTITDSPLLVNPNVGTTSPTLPPVTVTGKRIPNEEPTPDGGALAPVTVTGKRIYDDLIPLEQMPPLPSNKVTEVVAGKPEDKTGATIPIVIKPTTPTTPTTPARQPTPSQAQRLADAFAVPTLANTFYGNADFSTKRVEVDDEGNIIEVPYEPIDVSRPASKSLLANGGQITDNSTDPLVALLNHIMGSQDKNQLTEDDLLDIVRKGI